MAHSLTMQVLDFTTNPQRAQTERTRHIMFGPDTSPPTDSSKAYFLQLAKHFAHNDSLPEMWAALKQAEARRGSFGFDWQELTLPIRTGTTSELIVDCARDQDCLVHQSSLPLENYCKTNHLCTFRMLHKLGVGPEDHLLYLVLGINLYERQKLKLAIEMFLKAITYDSHSYLAWFGLANAYLLLNNYLEARKASSRFRKLRNTF